MQQPTRGMEQMNSHFRQPQVQMPQTSINSHFQSGTDDYVHMLIDKGRNQKVDQWTVNLPSHLSSPKSRLECKL